MSCKKGAGAIIAWVLLLGFTIGLATTVFLWTIRHTEKITESSTQFVECSMDCDNVMINVAVSDPCILTITNTRYFNIPQISIRKLDPANPASFIYNEKILEPKSKDKDPDLYTAILPTGYSGNNVTVMPIIKVKGEFCACKNKAITVEC